MPQTARAARSDFDRVRSLAEHETVAWLALLGLVAAAAAAVGLVGWLIVASIGALIGAVS